MILKSLFSVLVLILCFGVGEGAKENLSLTACNEVYTNIMMLDATGRLPSGILKLNFDLEGAYDECYEAKGLYTFAIGTYQIVPLIPSLLLDNFTGMPYVLKWGICLPKDCDVHAFAEAGQLENLSRVVSLGAYKFVPIEAVTLTTDPNPPLTDLSIAFIVVASVIFLFVIVGTLYDYWITKMENQKRKEQDVEKIPLMRGDGEIQEERGEPEEPKRSTGIVILTGILLGFSMIRNFANFTEVKIRDKRTAALDGFRVFCILWVVVAHTYLMLIFTGVSNPVDVRPDIQTRFLFQFIQNGTFSVDVFFVMSGFLMAFLMLKSLEKEGGKMKWGLIYFHRWWRLSPVYYLTIFFSASVYDSWMSGPQTPTMLHGQACRNNWWTNLLYINNQFPIGKGNGCIGWVWYLALDMQFFVISVPIIYALHHKPKLGASILAILQILAYIATMALAIEKGYGIFDFLLRIQEIDDGDVKDEAEEAENDAETGSGGGRGYWQNIYGAPWARVAPYFIGIALGYFCYRLKKDGDYVRPLLQQIGAFLLSLLFICAPLYSSYWGIKYEWVEVGDVLYITFARTFFGLGVAGLILMCFTGNGGFMNWFFSWPLFQVFAKLTYCIYLFHLIIITIYFVSFRHLPIMLDSVAIMYFFAVSIMTALVALAAHLIVELPFANMERAVLVPLLSAGGGSSRPKNRTT